MNAASARVSALLVLFASVGLLAQVPAPAPTSAPTARPDNCALVWIGRESAFEDYLRTARVVSQKELPVGVTRPRRAYFEPGGLAESMTWKKIPPGMRSGYWESYKAEIAGYEIDKLLQLQMVPPTVERQEQGELGAAVLWATPTRSFKEMGGVPGQKNVPLPTGADSRQWTRQVVRAKMFDNLIANKDPNLGNWLVDGDGHLILIDHSRSFTTMKNLVHEMDSIDRELWDRMKTLDEATLTAALGKVLQRNEIRAILDRRDRMERDVVKLAPSSPGPQ